MIQYVSYYMKRNKNKISKTDKTKENLKQK